MKKKFSTLSVLFGCLFSAQIYIPTAAGSTTNPSTNNVGVGTDTPTSKLSVYQNGTVGSNQLELKTGHLRNPDRYFMKNIIAGSGTDDMTFYLRHDGQMFVDGNVGIGTTTPQYKLEVNKGFIASKISDFTVGPTNRVGYLINELGTDIFDISYARDGLGILKMKTYLENPIVFGTYNAERMRITGGGDVGIGTDTPAYKLDVVGNVQFRDMISGGSNSWIFHTPDDGRKTLHIAYNNAGAWDWGKAFVIAGDTGNAALNGKFEAKEVKVTLTPTADFVFEEDYTLPKLEDVEKHIKEKKHLPDIASAKEMEKEGLNVGEFQIKLLQKIEELTLYTIEQNKQLTKLREDNEKMMQEISELKKTK